MRQLVAGDYPYSIVMKGGGVKGLALAGALVELGNFYSFNRHVGTSAGAIAAVLLAADYKPGELVEVFRNKNFTDFLDARWWMLPINLILRQGLYPGEAFRLWVADQLTTELRKQAEVRMEHLDRAVIYAARAGQGTLTFDSKGSRREAVASFAVRCSMAIPLFFTPTLVDGRRVLDGGLRNNFPLKKFIETFPGKPFIAIYLGKPDNRNERSFGSDILDIVVDGEERELVDSLPKNVAVIDTSPIGTVDFRMTDEEKDFLLAVGRVSALELLLRRNLDDGPSEQAVAALRQHVEDMRAAIIETRRIRQSKRNWRLCLVALVVALALWRYWLHR
jgi:predicted acylesterase/phospholipase RssA